MMYQSLTLRNGRIVVVKDGKCTELPKQFRHSKVTQINDKVFVNGFELTEKGWKRTLRAMWHYLF